MLNPAPIYDPAKTYEDNFDNGPFGGFDNPQVYQNHGQPQQSFLGFSVYEPFGIPAGPLLNGRYVAAALAKGFDVVCYKTQRSQSFGVNQFPNVLYVKVDGDVTLEKADAPQVGDLTPPDKMENLTITNSFGNPSKGPNFWIPDLKVALTHEGPGQLVIMSVVGTIKEGYSNDNYYDDFAETAKLAIGTGVKAIEVNLSCPNVANEGVLCYTPEAVEAICQKTRAAIGEVPLVAKLGYFSADQDDLLKQVIAKIEPYAQAISVINTIPGPVVDEHGQQALPGPNRLKSGLCGAGIKWAGLDMVNRIAALRKQKGLKFEIVGVGGVMTPADYDEYRAAGADCVMSATGAMWNPELAIEIKQRV